MKNTKILLNKKIKNFKLDEGIKTGNNLIERAKKSTKGITLIALVITIIVLLILAGISIAMLTGENGILNRATEAKQNNDLAQIEERIKLAYHAAIAKGKGNLNETDLDDALKDEFGDGNYSIDKDENDKVTSITVGQVTVPIDGNVTTGSNPSNPTNPSNPSDTSEPETPTPTSNLTTAEQTALEENGISEITGDAISNGNLKNNNRIKAVLTGEVPLTTEMTYKEGTKDTGLVVTTDSGEFVWVPVPVAIASSAPSTTGVDLAANSTTERPMAILQSGSSTDYQGILYDFSGTTSTAWSIVSVTGTSDYREPAYLTNSSYADASSYNTVGITQNSLQSEYNTMVASVNKYKGFYVARYELGLEGTTPVSKKASSSVTTAAANNSNTYRWYGLYSKCKEMYNQSSQNLTSTMIWGSQYDAMLNWMAKTGKTVGTADSSKYNTAETTGSKEEDQINKVYDLYGCNCEWTLEAGYTGIRVHRGGYYSSSNSPAYRYYNNPLVISDYDSSRSALYIKN